MFDFDDITPVKLNEEEPQLCQILYDNEYKETMGLLLALMQKDEHSERALWVTEKGIELLASHYTIWNYRYNILIGLNKDLYEELDWCEQIALENEKNYQIWNYRQLIIEKIIKDDGGNGFNPHREFPIMNAMLQEDTKNHHVWSYRKWLVERFDLYDDEKELQFVDQNLEYDLRNNSAWTHRFFLKFGPQNVSQDIVTQEIELTKSKILICPQNPSSWNYLFGIYKKFNKDVSELYEFCLTFANVQESPDVEVVITSTYALEMLATIYQRRRQPALAVKVYDLLSTTYDPIRANYWNYEKGKITV
ncbi:uncharacterized protein AC631_00433 [Debaryomyces fabryi]|uniref:Protein farnesyltransferase/geranylgeranyltransferase type-1 subunit alpha n=1 Tax=Debaryomyces fabryi TaxID=58627 RepID=A0A0V1Q5Z0_9ASCO|nr:uncharacterized protein AC631_00433 [Debaryomyces fabryi]KSA03798.1 hypothetical protein AC631_00433 [Debaryomyces fabryi]CUM45317.1 unnamed protein product [Debaryomyces fabryi]